MTKLLPLFMVLKNKGLKTHNPRQSQLCASGIVRLSTFLAGHVHHHKTIHLFARLIYPTTTIRVACLGAKLPSTKQCVNLPTQ